LSKDGTVPAACYPANGRHEEVKLQDLTRGSIAGHLFKTTSFMLVTMVFQTLYFLVDLFWVGRLGKEAVAGVGVAGNVMFIVLALTQMIGVGTTTLVSHAAGSKDHDRALLVFNQALVFSAAAGAAFFALAMALRDTYATGLSADAATARLAAEYLLWFIPAMALQFPMIVMASSLRGTGNFKPGMVVQTATVILNLVLAPVLIFGWGTGRPMGVGGAALATLIAVAVGTAWFTLYFRPRAAYLRFVPADWRPKLELWGHIFRIGLPSGAEFALLGVYLLFIYVIARPFGAAAQAGFGIGMRLLQAGFMPMVALGIAVAPVAGQNFGAREAARVKETFRTAMTWALVGMSLFVVLCQVAPAAMIRIFSNDPHVIEVGVEYLRIISWSFIGSGIVFVSSSMFQAMGNTVPSLVASTIRIVLVVVPALALARMPEFSLRTLWLVAAGSIGIQTVVSLVLLRREFSRRLAFAPTSAAAAPQPVVLGTPDA
jgi:putative MATE family efflux protein